MIGLFINAEKRLPSSPASAFVVTTKSKPTSLWGSVSGTSNHTEDNIKHLYFLTTGRCVFKYKNHEEGINRLLKAKYIKNTPWINYHLGFSYCFNGEPLRGTYYLNNALESYEKSGKYLNAVWCHNYLAVCYSYLHIYDNSKLHLEAALNGAKYFDMNSTLYQIYINLSDVYFSTKEFTKFIEFSHMAMELCDKYSVEYSLLAASNYVEAAIALGNTTVISPILEKYLVPYYKDTKYYNFLYFQYLSIYHFDEDIFYEKVVKEILLYYKKINYIELYSQIELRLITF